MKHLIISYDNEDIMFKRNELVEDRDIFLPAFIKYQDVNLITYEIMKQLYEDIQDNAYEFEDYEVVLPMLLHKNFRKVDHLGITQNIAVWDDQSRI